MVFSADPAASDRMIRSGFLPDRIVHLHPSRLCNLSCKHCYSSSGPSQKNNVDATMLSRALAVLRQEGYELVSFSGGEPLLYPPLKHVMDDCKKLGYRITVISNGLLASSRLDDLLKAFDGLAISFDGLSSTHNEMRGRHDAFERACKSLARLADMGLPVAAAISLRRGSIPELPDLADQLVSLGARALQVRPIVPVGRAESLDSSFFYTMHDYSRLYLTVLALQRELPQEVALHCDLAPCRGLWQQRDAYDLLLNNFESEQRKLLPLSDLVNPLVIDDDGNIRPISYDFDSSFDIGRIGCLSAEILLSYKAINVLRLKRLVAGALQELEFKNGLIDWFDDLTRRSALL